MASYHPRIAIIGGGPAGLTIARLLHLHSIPYTLFELRPRPTEESFAQPAGMLDLHTESGLAALDACDLSAEFAKHTDVCADTQIIVHKNGEVVYRDDGGPEKRPEISRNSLTKLLLDNSPQENIKWGHKLLSASRRETTDGATEVDLEFSTLDGAVKHTFDFLIGADGTWSRVRKLLTNTMPEYAGTQLITLTIRNVTARYPWLSEYVGAGSFMALGARHGIVGQRALQDSARFYVCLSTSDEHFATTIGIANATATQAGEKLLSDDELLGTFGDKLKDLVRIACEEDTKDSPGAKVDCMPLYILPIGHTWPHKSGITVLGDAAHVCTPWAGEGVNLALWDALDISQAIIKACETTPVDAKAFQTALDPLVEDFEKEMSTRAGEKTEEAVGNGSTMFGSEDGATAMAQLFEKMMAMAREGGQEEPEMPLIVVE